MLNPSPLHEETGTHQQEPCGGEDESADAGLRGLKPRFVSSSRGTGLDGLLQLSLLMHCTQVEPPLTMAIEGPELLFSKLFNPASVV